MRRVVVLVVLVLAVVGSATGHVALAHGGATPAVPVVDEVVPPLPDGVTFRIVSTQVSALVELTNPTAEVLEVTGADGTPWLRVGEDGVEVQAAARDTYATTSPSGRSVPADVADGTRPAAWVRVTDQPTWSWFEHRLHPDGISLPVAVDPEQRDAATVLEWELPLRYGTAEHVVRGRVEVRPATGTVTAALVGEVPAGITAQVLPGALPAVLLGLDGAGEVVVVGIAGEEYLRYSSDGVEVASGSPTHRAVEAARGVELPPTGADEGWVPVAGSPTHAWLEVRGRAPIDVPVEVREGGRRVELVAWEVPLLVDGAPVTLAGSTTWEPLGAGPPGEPGGAAGDGRDPLLVVVVAAVGLVGGAVAARRVRRRRVRS